MPSDFRLPTSCFWHLSFDFRLPTSKFKWLISKVRLISQETGPYFNICIVKFFEPLFGKKSLTYKNGPEARKKRQLVDRSFSHEAVTHYYDHFTKVFVTLAVFFSYLMVKFDGLVGGAVASWLVCSTPERAVRVRALARGIVLCSWARHFTLIVPLSTQVYKWVLANCWGNLTNCGEVTCDGLASRIIQLQAFSEAVMTPILYSSRHSARL